METEIDGHLPFLCIDIYRYRLAPSAIRRNGNLLTSTSTLTQDHTTIPRTYWAFFLNWGTEQRALCDRENLQNEMDYLKTTSKENGYGITQIQCLLFCPRGSLYLDLVPTHFVPL